MNKRTIVGPLKKSLTKFPIVVLTGPRQSGKTTLLKTVLKDYRYVSLEDPDNRLFALQDPRGFLKLYDQKVIFDEVQQSPQLFSYLQGIVDEQNTMGQFVLSGSQNFNLMESITQSLAGRVAVLKLLPFDINETKKANWLSNQMSKVFANGFYPALFQRKVDPDQYYDNYLETYVRRDVTQLINIQNNRTFKLFIKLCATRAGQLVNFNDLARDAGVSHTTARNWLSILETSYIVFFLQPYYKNFSKRIVKSPKLYFYDVGLLTHLLDVKDANILPSHQMWGSIFENMVIADLVKQKHHHLNGRDFWFWRDSKGYEIDLLYPYGDSLHIFEIKASTTIQAKMFEGLFRFEKISDAKIKSKTLIYGGKQDQLRTNLSIKSWININEI